MKLLHRIYLPIILILCAVQLFIGINGKNLQEWDESRNGANAYEMLKNGDFINLYYGNEPDTWNAKPPLMTWSIALSYNMLGYNEWGLRLPAALCTILFFIVLFSFIKRFDNPLTAFIVCLSLLSCKAINGFHGGINGDYDIMLSLFLLLSTYCFLLYLETKKTSMVYYVALFTGLAFLTKGTAAFVLMPGFLVYLFITGNQKPVLANKHVWFSVLLLLGIIGSWVMIAILNSPVYTHSTHYGSDNPIETMLVHDTYRRLTSSDFDDKNIRNYLFFINAIDVRFNVWNYLFYISISLGLYRLHSNRNNILPFIRKDNNRLTLFSLCMAIPLTCVLNFSVNMHDWYFMPVWAFIAIITVKGICYFTSKYTVGYYMIAIIIVFTYTRQIIYLRNLPTALHHSLNKNNPELKNEPYIVLTENPRQHLYLYLRWMNIDFIKVTDINTLSEHRGRVIITFPNTLQDLGPAVNTLQYADEYCIARLN